MTPDPHLDATTVRFRRSSFCGPNGCVEVAPLPDGGVALRDSKDPRSDAPILRFTGEEWDAFLAGAAAGEFTRSAL